jgi:hypothetical protein
MAELLVVMMDGLHYHFGDFGATEVERAEAGCVEEVVHG